AGSGSRGEESFPIPHSRRCPSRPGRLSCQEPKCSSRSPSPSGCAEVNSRAGLFNLDREPLISARGHRRVYGVVGEPSVVLLRRLEKKAESSIVCQEP